MAEPLFELLAPHFDSQPASRPRPSAQAATTTDFLARLSSLRLSTLATTEPQSLQQSSYSALLSLQALSTRSQRAIIEASEHLSVLSTTLPALAEETETLHHAIPELDEEAARFSRAYGKTAENPLLDRRKTAMLLSRNVERLSDILDLPSLLSSAISASSASPISAATSAPQSLSTSAASYASALDLDGHIKRLHTLYPQSALISSVSDQAEQAMRGMTTNLIGTLRAPGIKLAGAIRTIGWLRRVAPELDESGGLGIHGGQEGGLGALFLVCRLANLVSMLDALEPLRELADQESRKRRQDMDKQKDDWSGGQQTERYLKRYIEIFREQSFAIISMYRSIFPSPTAEIGTVGVGSKSGPKAGAKPSQADPLQPLPSALSTFPLHLVELLVSTLRRYMPNVKDKASRESLLTQVLYCAGSLGRLGADFSILLALLEEDGSDIDGEGESQEEADGRMEWAEVMKKHRVLASRLELLASGVSGGSQDASDTSRKPAVAG
ncbi:MAG: hypothetical protein M1832_005450 [Thelocarpon impressellum]|nr:MAG: hypothetical protein M1832_005450 [Thelocarpon impressellum]